MKKLLALMSEQAYLPAEKRTDIHYYNYYLPLSTNDVGVWYNSDNVIIAYRGTVPTNLSDLYNDALILSGQRTLRGRQLEEHFLNVTRVIPNHKYIFTGHSLGGTLATEIYELCKKFPKLSCQFAVFNRGSSPLETLSKIGDKNEKVHYHIKYDPISMFYVRDPRVTHLIENTPLLDKHTIKNWTRD